MKSVCFLMLDPTNLPWDLDKSFLCKRHQVDEVWTLNDYYQFYVNLIPDRIFQIHKDFTKHPELGRFTGNWIREYNKSGAKVITTSHYDGLECEVLLPMDKWEIDWKDKLNCTISFMFIMAIEEKYKKIIIDGTNMLHAPYNWEVSITLNWIDTCRNQKIEFYCHMEKKWRAMSGICQTDPDPVPYWKRP